MPNLETAFAEVLKNDKIKYLELFAKYAQFFVPKKTDVTSKGESIGELTPQLIIIKDGKEISGKVKE